MKYTNKFNLPDAFYRAVINDPYTKGESDFSATGLLNPPRATVLLEQHKDTIEIDVSTRVATTIGQGVHSILERAARPGDIIEKRFFAPFKVDNEVYMVSAQVDIFEADSGTLSDWKTTKAYAFHKKAGSKFEYEAQMNIGAFLMRASGIDVKELRIIGLLKDWDYRKAKEEPGYPPTEIMTMEIDMWSLEETEIFIKDRIKAIVQARIELPRCTSKESWGGNKCRQWCDAASVCSQYQESKKTGVLHEVSKV